MKNGFVIIRNFINSDFSDYLQNYFRILYEGGYLKSGDPDAPNSPCIYGDPAFDCLLLKKKQDVEKAVSKNLIPQYSYSRIYQPKSILTKHLDRSSCEYSVTLSLGGEYEEMWPIWIKDYNGVEHCIKLDSGDAMIYDGVTCEHWRDEFKGEKQYQVFMHYVDINGKFKDIKYDGRSHLGIIIS